MAAALLLAALAALALFVRRDVAEFRRFVSLTRSADRRRTLRKWVAQSFLLFVGMPLAGLALLGRFDAIAGMPAEFAAAAALAGRLGPGDELAGFLGGAMLGALIGGSLLAGVLGARQDPAGAEAAMVDLAAMMPRNGAETWHAALLSVNAGVAEELFYRLYLPLLIALVSGSALAGFAVAAVLFGITHLYQGAAGIVVTMVVGAAMTLVYLISGSLVWPIVAHAVLDLNALVLRPTVTRLARRTRAG